MMIKILDMVITNADMAVRAIESSQAFEAGIFVFLTLVVTGICAVMAAN